MVDPISDMFTQIRNAYTAKKGMVVIPYSKFKMEIAKLLKKENFVKNVVRRGKKTQRNIEIMLFYKDGEPALCQIQRVSKSSRRVYFSVKNRRFIRRGRGLLIMSTPRGVMTDRAASREKVGGEIVGRVW